MKTMRKIIAKKHSKNLDWPFKPSLSLGLLSYNFRVPEQLYVGQARDEYYWVDPDF
jgi:hypothetical protein